MLREHDYDDSPISILILCPSTRRRDIERERERESETGKIVTNQLKKEGWMNINTIMCERRDE